jgi:hypothetical protein
LPKLGAGLFLSLNDIPSIVRFAQQRTLFPMPADFNIPQIARGLIRNDAVVRWVDNAEQIYNFWVALGKGAAIREQKNGLETDEHVITAFQFLDSSLKESCSANPLTRLAHVALVQKLDEVKELVEVNRLRGRVRPRSGYRNASIAMDLYLAAQRDVVDRSQARKQLHRRLRHSKRWTAIAGPCVFLVMIYGEEAEKIM